MLREVKMNVPVIGPVKSTFDEVVAPGFYKVEEKTEAERFLFRWIGGDISGVIMISGTDKIIKYDYSDQEYWFESPAEYFANDKPDSSNDKKGSFSFITDNDDPPKISRFVDQGMETIRGYRTKKWTTTLTSVDGKMLIEEWFVDEIPLIDLYDSLKSEIFSLFNPDTSSFNNDKFEFTSNFLLEKLDTLKSFKTIPGHSIKTNFILYEGDNNPKVTVGYEMLELYAESVDTVFFTIPEQFKRTVK